MCDTCHDVKSEDDQLNEAWHYRLLLGCLIILMVALCPFFASERSMFFEYWAYNFPCLAAVFAGGGLYYKVLERQYFSFSVVALLCGLLSFSIQHLSSQHPISAGPSAVLLVLLAGYAGFKYWRILTSKAYDSLGNREAFLTPLIATALAAVVVALFFFAIYCITHF